MHLYCIDEKQKFIETEGRLGVTRGLGMEREGYYLMSTVSLWDDEEGQRMHNGDGCTTF